MMIGDTRKSSRLWLLGVAVTVGFSVIWAVYSASAGEEPDDSLEHVVVLCGDGGIRTVAPPDGETTALVEGPVRNCLVDRKSEVIWYVPITDGSNERDALHVYDLESGGSRRVVGGIFSASGAPDVAVDFGDTSYAPRFGNGYQITVDFSSSDVDFQFVSSPPSRVGRSDRKRVLKALKSDTTVDTDLVERLQKRRESSAESTDGACSAKSLTAARSATPEKLDRVPESECVGRTGKTTGQCGTIQSLPNTELALVTVSTSCGDHCYRQQVLYDPKQDEFIDAEHPEDRSEEYTELAKYRLDTIEHLPGGTCLFSKDGEFYYANSKLLAIDDGTVVHESDASMNFAGWVAMAGSGEGNGVGGGSDEAQDAGSNSKPNTDATGADDSGNRNMGVEGMLSKTDAEFKLSEADTSGVEGRVRVKGLGSVDTREPDGGAGGTGAKLGTKETVSGTYVLRDLETGDACGAENVRSVVDAKESSLEYCYQKDLQLNPELAGQVVLEWTIGEKGRVASTAVSSSSLGEEETVSCIQRVVKRMTFQKPDGESCDVEATMKFSTGE